MIQLREPAFGRVRTADQRCFLTFPREKKPLDPGNQSPTAMHLRLSLTVQNMVYHDHNIKGRFWPTIIPLDCMTI